jgi:hypothetical protein
MFSVGTGAIFAFCWCFLQLFSRGLECYRKLDAINSIPIHLDVMVSCLCEYIKEKHYICTLKIYTKMLYLKVKLGGSS